jgi:hypothetical protein
MAPPSAPRTVRAGRLAPILRAGRFFSFPAEPAALPTTGEIMNENRRSIEPVVFWGSAGLIVIFVFLSFIYTMELGDTFQTVQSLFSTCAGWIYILG